MAMEYWVLPEYEPRPEQVQIIDEVECALESGYENIVLEAGVGIGKSAVAVTVARSTGSAYVLTMTKQLQQQYLDDFNNYLTEIKGRSNYWCNNFFKKGKKKGKRRTCKDCYLDEENNKRAKKDLPRIPLCQDCHYRLQLQAAKNSPVMLTNYDYLFYAGNYAGQFNARDLLVMDEAHNFEQKVMSLVSENLSRNQIFKVFGFDIFEKVMRGEPLKNIKTSEYWIEIVNKCIDKCMQFEAIGKDARGKPFDSDKSQSFMDKFRRLLNGLNKDFIIDLPLRKEILMDKEPYRNYLQMALKPLSIERESQQLLRFGGQRLFMTGTLGGFEQFCRWNGLDVEDSYYIYRKSPFPVSNRPIIKRYVCSMRQGAWQNPHIVKYVQRILDEHKDEKGLIHVASNQQAWWLKNELNSNLVWVANGGKREETIRRFENSNKPITLIGASLKDGVDFKGDKCRYQILFKIPFPGLHDEQVKRRKALDESWYMNQTIQPLQQAYGRGVRDMDDYCKFYVLDMDFEQLIMDYGYLFNKYFLEAIR